MARTKLLCLQIQPARAKSLNLETIAALLVSHVMSTGVRELFSERGRADSWINLSFRSTSIDATWRALQEAFRHRRWGAARRRSNAGPGAASASAACDHCETGAKATRAATAATAGNGSGARTQTTPVVSVGDLRASAKARRRG